MENKELVKREETTIVVKNDSELACYLDTGLFNQTWRVANMFARAGLVPEHYKGSPEDCMIVFNQAANLGIDPMLFMQKTYVIKGKLGMETQMAIALTNKAKIFKDLLKYEYSGEKTGTTDTRKCKASAITQNGMLCEAECSVQDAKDAGWWSKINKYGKDTSLWPKLTSDFLTYRAAIRLIRRYCPQVLFGMDTVEELHDSQIIDITPESPSLPKVKKQKQAEPDFVDPFTKKSNPQSDFKEGTAAQVAQDVDMPSATGEKEDSTSVYELRKLYKKQPAAVTRAISTRGVGTKIKKALNENNEELAATLIPLINIHVKHIMLSANVLALKQAFVDNNYLDHFDKLEDEDNGFNRQTIKDIIKADDDPAAVKVMDIIRSYK